MSIGYLFVVSSEFILEALHTAVIDQQRLLAY